MSDKIAIFYEHPDWFKPLFAALDRRGVSYDKLHIASHTFYPAVKQSPYSLIVNRVSAFPSGGSPPQIIWYAQHYLAYLHRIGANVINGYHSFRVATSKADQLNIFEQLGLRYPRARVIHRPQQAAPAAAGLNFPLLIKPNIGGSGVGIQKFESRAELEQAVSLEQIDLGIDGVALVQEYLPAKDKVIVRVEILNGDFLYGLRVPISDHSFNYCPADGCNIDNPGLPMAGYTPPAEVIAQAKQIIAASQSDLGGIEYLVNEMDGQIYFYDINPLSNFVANALEIVGFDPTERLVDFILARRHDPRRPATYK